MSGPIGSAYPGNFMTLVFAGLFLIVSLRSAKSAYQRRREAARLQNWEADVGVSVVTFLASIFALYAVWVHR